MPDLLDSVRVGFFRRLLRVFFNLLYHQFAWSYDLVAAAVSTGLWQMWVLSARPFLPGPRILELGFGPGHLQCALRLENKEVFGLDESPQMCRQAGQRLRRAGLSPNLILAKAQWIPFPSDWFDQVAATFPSEYIYKAETLDEISRVLKHGGTAVIVPQAIITGRGLHHRWSAWLFRFTGQTWVIQETWLKCFLQPLLQAGFELTFTLLEVDDSKIQVIRAIKP